MAQGPTADIAAVETDRALLALLRLQALVMADPPPLPTLQTMADMIFASPRAIQIGIGVPFGAQGMVRYLAHAGRAEPRHQPFVMQAIPIATRAMGLGELVQVSHTEGVPHVCVHVPILGRKRVIGFFGIGILGRVPIEPWREEVIWVTSDLMALLLLRHERLESEAATVDSAPLNGLTPRQRDVLFDLVEHGDGNVAMGQRLRLSARTIKIHLKAAFRRLAVRTRGDAIRTVLTQHRDWLERERAARRLRRHEI